MARILLVDNYRNAADSLALCLAMSGHEVRIAYSVEEAMALADILKPELLVTEATLTGYPPKPATCGFCMGQKIMAKHHCPGIILTTHGQERYLEKAKRRGFARHLLKTCDPALLIATVDEVLKEDGHTAARSEATG